MPVPKRQYPLLPLREMPQPKQTAPTLVRKGMIYYLLPAHTHYISLFIYID
ncbi:hypothetical protein IQ07DRAFT_593600, partial [Pyrenochaeta sp. DS3sAY3a]